ncbi:MAG: EamA family transporter [Candidatus Dormibacteraeota bacterium]|nr:EamA family transporter [Candidatus Dormibacteraeota bacterium]
MAIVWGLNFVVIDVGLKVFPPLLFAALRFALVAFPAVLLVRRPCVPWRYIVAAGCFSGALQFGLLFVSLDLGMPPGLGSLVLQLQIVFTIALATIVLGEHPTVGQLVGGTVALLGVGLIALGRGGVAIPAGALALAIASAASWGIGNVVTRIARPPDAAAFLIWTSLVPPIPLAALSLIIEGPRRLSEVLSSLTLAAVLALAYVVVLATGFGWGAWAYLLRRHPTSDVVPFALVVPVAGIAAAALFAHEPPAPAEIGGGLIVLMGLLLVTRASRPAPSPGIA